MRQANDFLTDLQRRLAARIPGAQETADPLNGPHATRRQVVVAASAAALAGGAGVVAGAATERVAPDGHSRADRPSMRPSDGSWQVVAASADVPAGVMHPFDVGSVVGFVRRVNGQPEAISGVCTHQGCRLWFDRPLDQLRCPCHSTSFSPTGQVLEPSAANRPRPVTAAGRSRTERIHRGVRGGEAAHRAGLRCNRPPISTCVKVIVRLAAVGVLFTAACSSHASTHHRDQPVDHASSRA